MEGILTPESIRERIDYLQEDSLICQSLLKSPKTPLVEKSEYRMRTLANAQEIMRLESTLLLLKSDPFMNGR